MNVESADAYLTNVEIQHNLYHEVDEKHADDTSTFLDPALACRERAREASLQSPRCPRHRAHRERVVQEVDHVDHRPSSEQAAP
jgi:hypothetical protein